MAHGYDVDVLGVEELVEEYSDTFTAAEQSSRYALFLNSNLIIVCLGLFFVVIGVQVYQKQIKEYSAIELNSVHNSDSEHVACDLKNSQTVSTQKLVYLKF